MMKRYGFTLLEIMLVVAILGLLIAIAVPSFTRSRTTVYRDKCINNLRRIKIAKAQWSLEYNKSNDETPTAAELDSYIEDDIWDEVYTTGHNLICPSDSGGTVNSSYNINNVITDPTCKINPGEHHL